jgi:hypothetical protein
MLKAPVLHEPAGEWGLLGSTDAQCAKLFAVGVVVGGAQFW